MPKLYKYLLRANATQILVACQCYTNTQRCKTQINFSKAIEIDLISIVCCIFLEFMLNIQLLK